MVQIMSSLAMLQRHCWLTSRKLAEKQYKRAREMMTISHDPADIGSALVILDSALKLWPKCDKALELKARALLFLRRFTDVFTMLHDYIPTNPASNLERRSPCEPDGDKHKLITETSTYDDDDDPFCIIPSSSIDCRCFSTKFSGKFSGKRLRSRLEKEKWRYLLLGQACCHLGRMEDAMILLQKSRKVANVAFRCESGHMREDTFSLGNAEADFTTHLLGNIKFLLRRRAAAMAALEAGLYSESIRHFSKIVDGRRGVPQGFLSECYTHRANAYQAANRYPDAIADCNRALSLNPTRMDTLCTRASLFETARCFPECLQDLEQLKTLYESLLRQHNSEDLQESLNYTRNKLAAIRSQPNSTSPNYHMILGLSRDDCSSVGDVERAYLLLSLKHRPDKAALFVDRCELTSARNADVVREEARASALRLFRLIHKSYRGVISLIAEEEARKCEKDLMCKLKDDIHPSHNWRQFSNKSDDSAPHKEEGEVKGIDVVDNNSDNSGTNNATSFSSITTITTTASNNTCREPCVVGGMDMWMPAHDWHHTPHSVPLSVT